LLNAAVSKSSDNQLLIDRAKVSGPFDLFKKTNNHDARHGILLTRLYNDQGETVESRAEWFLRSELQRERGAWNMTNPAADLGNTPLNRNDTLSLTGCASVALPTYASVFPKMRARRWDE
jgi:hypothetical protein